MTDDTLMRWFFVNGEWAGMSEGLHGEALYIVRAQGLQCSGVDYFAAIRHLASYCLRYPAVSHELV